MFVVKSGEVECQDTDVTEDLPVKEIDKSLTNDNGNDVERPSTKIFLLNEGKDNDTERNNWSHSKTLGQGILKVPHSHRE